MKLTQLLALAGVIIFCSQVVYTMDEGNEGNKDKKILYEIGVIEYKEKSFNTEFINKDKKILYEIFGMIEYKEKFVNTEFIKKRNSIINNTWKYEDDGEEYCTDEVIKHCLLTRPTIGIISWYAIMTGCASGLWGYLTFSSNHSKNSNILRHLGFGIVSFIGIVATIKSAFDTKYTQSAFDTKYTHHDEIRRILSKKS